MAPGFLSKFVRGSSSSSHSRERSDASRPSSSNSRPSTSTSTRPNVDTSPPKTPTTATHVPSVPNKTPTANISTAVKTSKESFHTVDSTTSSQPQFTVIPPSPLSGQASLSSRSGHDTEFSVRRINDVNNNKGAGELSHSLGRTTSVTPNSSADDITPTPTPTATPAVSQVAVTAHNPRARPVTPTAPASPEDNEHENPKTSPTMPKPSDNDLRHSSSNRSLNISINHSRAATAPETTRDSGHGENGTVVTMTPIVESPTSLRPPEFPSSTQEAGNASLMPSSRDADAVSLVSTTAPNGATKEKKRPWKRSTTRQPTGLASALIASGTAMAHPTLSAVHQASFSSAAMQAQQSGANSLGTARKASGSSGSPPYGTRSPPGSSNHIKGKSADMSPASKKSRRQGSIRSGVRRTSISMHSDGASEYHPEDRPGYYSGLEVDSDEDDSADSESMLDGMDDIPVTGFAVASNKRNADFHELFPNIPEGDYLIEDYGCAIQREILVQGRLYVSENHICFHANIFGWITDLSIPMCEITHLEKRMTAYVIPNAIQITTRQSKSLFASFLSRETTYDVIYNIWRLARPEEGINNSSRPSLECATAPDTAPTSIATSGGVVVRAPKVTTCACSKDNHYAEVALDCVLPGTPDRIHNLIFASGFIKEFMAVDQKLLDIQISDWQPTAPGSNLLTRNMSYIKPLNASLGPKQTKCEIKDEVVYNDPEHYLSTVTTIRNPDVPSGGVFSVKSRTCLSWASSVSTRVIVTTQVEWTGRSFIRSIIEKSVLDGQRAYHSDLEVAMRNYIQQHQSEFIPEGIDVAALPDVVVAPPTPALPTSLEKLSSEEEKKRREQERNQRGLQWAWDTFEGASQVAIRSTKDALELVRDAWEQSSSTTIMWFVIVALVISNLWSVILMGSREEAGRRKEMKKMEEREKWVQGIVTALWDELGKQQKDPQAKDSGSMGVLLNSLSSGNVGGGGGDGGRPSNPTTWKNEIREMQSVLEQLEQRIKVMKGSLSEVNTEKLDQLD